MNRERRFDHQLWVAVTIDVGCHRGENWFGCLEQDVGPVLKLWTILAVAAFVGRHEGLVAAYVNQLGQSILV